MEIRSDTAHLISNRAADYSTVFLRTALCISFLSGVADRFGLWGAYGQPNVGWGDWRQEHPELNERIELTRERMRETLLARVKLAAEDDWRTSVELLKLSFASDYRRVVQPQPPQQHLHVHGDTFVLSPERQQELREQRRRILATTKGAHVLGGITAGVSEDEEPEPDQPQTTRSLGPAAAVIMPDV